MVDLYQTEAISQINSEHTMHNFSRNHIENRINRLKIRPFLFSNYSKTVSVF